jgi:hypothetical protein
LFLSSDIVRKIKSRERGWAGHVASMREKKNAYKVLAGKTGMIATTTKI